MDGGTVAEEGEGRKSEGMEEPDGRECLSGQHGCWLNGRMAGMCQIKLVRR